MAGFLFNIYLFTRVVISVTKELLSLLSLIKFQISNKINKGLFRV